MPEPTPARPRRRINPDKAPYDRLPAIKADTRHGPIHVVRGEFNVDELTDAQRRDVEAMFDRDFVVFTNSFGGHQLAYRGQLLDTDLDLTRFGTLPHERDVNDLLGFKLHPENLEHLVFELRWHAEQAAQLAATYQELIDTGWQLNRDPDTRPFGNLVNTSADDEATAPGPNQP